MKKLFYLLLLASILLFTRCTRDDAYYESASFEPYSKPLVIKSRIIYPNEESTYVGKTVYTYNSRGLETSCKNYLKDHLTSEKANYRYQSKKTSYSYIIYEKGVKTQQTDYITTFDDAKYTRLLTTEEISSFPISDNPFSVKMVYTYDSANLESSCKKYESYIFVGEFIDYKYEDKKSFRSYVRYTSGGDIFKRMDYTTTFDDLECTRPLVIEVVFVEADNMKIDANKEIYAYNTQGFVTNYKKYFRGMLETEHTNYIYGDKKSSYIEIYYSMGGSKIAEIEHTITYKY